MPEAARANKSDTGGALAFVNQRVRSRHKGFMLASLTVLCCRPPDASAGFDLDVYFVVGRGCKIDSPIPSTLRPIESFQGGSGRPLFSSFLFCAAGSALVDVEHVVLRCSFDVDCL